MDRDRRQDEEGESSGSSQSPESRGERDTDAASAPRGDGDGREPEPEPERRERVQKKLRWLGQDAESRERKPTAALTERIRSVRRERGSGAGRDLELGVSAWESAPGEDEIFAGMVRLFGNAESAEEEEEEEKKSVEEDEQRDVILSHIQRLQASSALARLFPEVWARSRLDCGCLAEEERLDGDPVPFQRQRPKPPEVEERMAELLAEYREQGVVVEGSSASNSPLTLIPKPKGRGWRLSLHCGALNAATPVGPPERPSAAGILASVNPRSR